MKQADCRKIAQELANSKARNKRLEQGLTFLASYAPQPVGEYNGQPLFAEAEIAKIRELASQYLGEPKIRYYEIIGKYIKEPIGATTSESMDDVREEEPGATFREISEEEYLKYWRGE